jgi:hypothetical protein
MDDMRSMPTYCYRDPRGGLHEITMTLKEWERRERNGRLRYRGVRLVRDIAAEHGDRLSGGRGWPLLSEAAGVHPNQVSEVREAVRKRGVALDFTRDGRAIFESHAHRRQALRALGMHDKNGYC